MQFIKSYATVTRLSLKVCSRLVKVEWIFREKIKILNFSRPLDLLISCSISLESRSRLWYGRNSTYPAKTQIAEALRSTIIVGGVFYWWRLSIETWG
jgi:hypothetical protein